MQIFPELLQPVVEIKRSMIERSSLSKIQRQNEKEKREKNLGNYLNHTTLVWKS